MAVERLLYVVDPMRVIKPSTLRQCSIDQPRAKEQLEAWYAIVKEAKWQHPPDMQKSFPKADPTKVKSGKTVYIFNIRRNEFRLVCAIHFDRQKVFLLRFMTHAEYEKGDWKNEL